MKVFKYEKEFEELHDNIKPWVERSKQQEFFINFYLDTINKEFWEIEHVFSWGGVRTRAQIYSDMKEKIKDLVMIPFADFPVNTACTLRCKNCSQALPYYPNNRIFSAETLIEEINTIFKSIDYIHFFSLLGGEPFLNKDLSNFIECLKELMEKGRIGFVRIVTNGTIIPSENVLRALKSNNIYVSISNYEHILSEKQLKTRRQLIALFMENHIQYNLQSCDKEWFDIGTMEKSNLGVDLRESFMTCNFKNCCTVIEGKMYRCCRQYAAEQIHQHCLNEKEYIDFNILKSRNEMKKELFEFYTLSENTACLWCLPNCDRKRIKGAQQLPM